MRVTAQTSHSQKMLEATLGQVDFNSALALAFATTADRNLIPIGPDPERHAFC